LVAATTTAVAADDRISGFAEPLQQVEVAAPEAGLIESIRVREGDAVDRGQTLAQLDVRVLEASLALARAKAQSTAQVDAAAAEYQLRKDRLDAIEQLQREGHANTEELQRARRDAAVAESKLKAAKEDVALSALEARQIEAQIDRRIIRSPVDGVVIRLTRQQGEFLSPADPVLATIANLDTLRVKFHVPTRQAKQYAVGQTVDIFFPDDERLAPARIDFVSPVTNADSGTVRVDVVIDNKQGLFRSGVRCTFLPLLTRTDTVR
jgi:RND family efflux transporter MFP subunit